MPLRKLTAISSLSRDILFPFYYSSTRKKKLLDEYFEDVLFVIVIFRSPYQFRDDLISSIIFPITWEFIWTIFCILCWYYCSSFARSIKCLFPEDDRSGWLFSHLIPWIFRNFALYRQNRSINDEAPESSFIVCSHKILPTNYRNTRITNGTCVYVWLIQVRTHTRYYLRVRKQTMSARLGLSLFQAFFPRSLYFLFATSPPPYTHARTFPLNVHCTGKAILHRTFTKL